MLFLVKIKFIIVRWICSVVLGFWEVDGGFMEGGWGGCREIVNNVGVWLWWYGFWGFSGLLICFYSWGFRLFVRLRWERYECL